MHWITVAPWASGLFLLMTGVTAVNAPLAGVFGHRGFPLLPRLVPTLVVAIVPLSLFLVPRTPLVWHTPFIALILIGWFIGENQLVNIGNRYYTKIVAPSAVAQPTP